MILPLAKDALDVDHVAVGLYAVDMSQVADVTPDLGCQIGLQVLRATLLEQRVGMIFVGDVEFQSIDDVADARCLLCGPINDHPS